MSKNPKLTKTAVQIKYWADDGYKSDTMMKAGQGQVHMVTGEPIPPELALLDALEELQRLCNLFGFAKQADERIAAVNGRMATWRSQPAQALIQGDHP